MSRVYLSSPHLTGEERALVLDALDSNWIAPLGPHVDAFEEEVAAATGTAYAAAMASGTGALHIALLLLGVEAGDEVFCSDFTFAATANAIRYVGAAPVFIDADRDSWNMDPGLLEEALRDAAGRGRLPRAVVVVDLYGQCADYDAITALCRRYEVPLVEDAAEALGATYRGRPAGSFGDLGVVSFNGNKIITCGGGGMLVSQRKDWIERARFLSTQARDPAPHYEHSVVGYNYRLGNVPAAIGRGQLRGLAERVARRRAINARYRERLADLPGLAFMPEAPDGQCTFWLTCVTIDEQRLGVSPEALREHLERADIECRPTWKPMHLQPVFRDFRVVGGGVSAELFRRGLCLPSGSAMSAETLDRVIDTFRSGAQVGVTVNHDSPRVASLG